jgi:Periplasmic protein TonB, links inner and outer membranes
MKKDLISNSVAVYTQRRKNKSIWMKSCMIVALVVVLLTSYVLIFPARTVEKELICGKQEHIHGPECYSQVLCCGMQDEESHQHTEECYTSMLTCTLDEHTHTEDCYAEIIPETKAPETEAPTTETKAAETTEATEAAVETTAPAAETTEPAETEAPDPEATKEPVETEPADPEEPTEPVETEPIPETTEPEPVETTEPVGEETPVRIPELTFRPASDLPTETIVYPEEGTDLEDYLESVIFQRQEGGAYVEDTWFENGETVKAAIIYDIPKDIVTPDNRYVYYQLPEGIQPIEETSGDVLDEGVVVGVYTIDTDGMIHILFNEDFANGNAIMGTVEFSCWVFANDDDTDRVIEFGNNAGSITITVPDEQKYDLNLGKTGVFNSDYTGAEYVLTISSTKGSGDPLSVIDLLSIQTPSTLFGAAYEAGSFAIRHVAADGTVTPCDEYNIQWASDGMSFNLTGLPALGAGERYEIVYNVELDPDLSGSFELDNEATAVCGKMEATATFFITYVCDVNKSGAFNPTTGLIDWVITVNPDSRPVAGWRIEDDLPYPAVGKVFLTNANGVQIADITPADGRTLRYTFPPGLPARPYFIRYSTAAPTTASTVRNTVRLINEHDISVVSEVDVVERTEGVDKTLGAKYARPDGMVQTFWSFTVMMPVGDLESYTFRDNISTPIMDMNEGIYLDNNLHYGVPAELEAAFRGNLRLISDGNTYYYGDEANDYVDFTLTYLDARGQVLDPTDETSHVSRVLFQLTPHDGTTFHGYEIVADNYPTWLDASSAEEGDYWSYQNYLYLRDKIFDVVPAFYRKGDAFEKQVKGSNGRFTSDGITISYSGCDGVLEYRLLLDLAALASDNFTVSDLLPEGMELVEGSPRVFFTNDSYNGQYSGTFSNPENFAVAVESKPDGTSLVTFTGTGITDQMKQTYAYIAIVYQVRLTDETLWNDYTESSATFTNVATWDQYTATQTATVVNSPKRLEKTGAQLMDGENEPTNRLHFTVLINAAAEDLNPEGDTLTLTDTFSSGIASEIEFSSVKLYYYDPTQPNDLGNRVMSYEYQLFYNTQTKQMTVIVPDETALVLVYEYTVDFTAILDGQTMVSNSAELTGGYHSSTSMALRGVNSSATAWQRVISVTKVDEENYAKVLPDTEFILEYWDVEHQVWTRAADSEGNLRTYVTDASGKVILNLVGSDKDVETSILYRLTETRPAPGYDADGTIIWLICMPRASGSREQVFAEAAAGSDAVFDETNFFGVNGGSCVVSNHFSGLTVDKRWFNLDGSEMTDVRQDSITVHLYVSTDPNGADPAPTLVEPSEKVQNPVVVRADEDWTYTWGNLPTHDENGNVLYYFVTENEIPGYIPRYINNGITGGTIVIANDSEPYVLPSTGKEGSGAIEVLGIMLMLTASVVYITRKKKTQAKKIYK